MTTATFLRFYQIARGLWLCGPDGSPPVLVDPNEQALSAMWIVLHNASHPVLEAELRGALAGRNPGPRAAEFWKPSAIGIVRRCELPDGVTVNPLLIELQRVRRHRRCFWYYPPRSAPRIAFSDEDCAL